VPPARPSKIALFRMLWSDLNQIRSGTGLDAASADMSNCTMFRTEQYVGVDRDRELLEKGLARHPDTIGIIADLTSVQLPPDSSSVCVSTNTMSHLDEGMRTRTTKALAEAVAPSGVPIIHYPIESDLDAHLAALRERFEVVDVHYFRNPISLAYERFFERDGWLGTQPKSRTLRGIRLLLSHGERLTSRVRAINDQAYVRCSGKRGGTQTQPFDLSGFKKLGEHLYQAPAD
jgi:hypothetical protein